MGSRSRNIVAVDRISDIEIRKGMVFYKSTVAGETEGRCMPLAEWDAVQLEYAKARERYLGKTAPVVPFPRSISRKDT